MNYEKKYKEALSKAKDMLSYKEVRQEDMEYLFPELKNNDEGIRKTLIDFFSKGAENGEQTNGIYDKDIITWLNKQDNKPVNIDIESMVSSYKQRLESQGNGGMKNNPLVNMCLTAFKHGVEEVLQELNLKEFEKPQGKSALEAIKEEKIDNKNCATDKVEPKFHEGDWIVWQDKCCKVNYNGCGYELVDQNGLSTSLEYGTVDENAHIWDITKDAEDGDILVSDNIIFIFNRIHDIWIKCHCSLYEDDSFYGGDFDLMHVHYGKEVFPATKEQCDKLLKAMTDAGYIFDFKKKKLKELKKVEQNPAWNEEDERIRKTSISFLKHYADKGYENAVECIDWLEFLKERVQPQNHWKPSEEQMDALEHFVRSIGESGYISPYDANLKLVHSLLNDLKKLK